MRCCVRAGTFPNVRTRRRLIATAFIGLLLFGTWWVAPAVAVWSMALSTKKGEESSARARDRIVFFGERAIGSTISSIERNSPWRRRYCYLPSALEQIGGPARERLLERIDRQKEPLKRAYLISALQSAFDDMSRFDTVMEDHRRGELSAFALLHMESAVRHNLPDAPPLVLTEHKVEVNPEFLQYREERGR